MSLEETINKLIKAVENSSNAKDNTPSNQTLPNIPWTGSNPPGCECVLWLNPSNGEETKTSGKDVDCIRLKCKSRSGTTYYGRVLYGGGGHWEPQ